MERNKPKPENNVVFDCQDSDGEERITPEELEALWFSSIDFSQDWRQWWKKEFKPTRTDILVNSDNVADSSDGVNVYQQDGWVCFFEKKTPTLARVKAVLDIVEENI
jgi:hypothetical protein